MPLPVRRIRFWQHGRAVRQMTRAYSPGVDALVDRIRSADVLSRFALQHLLLPVYFAREQGWAVHGERGEMAAIMYLRREHRRGLRVLHIDDISVAARYRGRGLAQRLLRLADEMARHEQRPFLKLAVTVANTPAVILYRRLGYQDQHHRYFAYLPSTIAERSATAPDVSLRPLRPRQAWEEQQRFYRMELRASAPAVAELMAVYYPRGAGGVGVPRVGAHRSAIEHRGQPIGYGDAFRRGAQWNLRLSLGPDVWGSEIERQAIQRLTSAVTNSIGHDDSTTFGLHVPSAAHFDAVCAGPTSLASELGLVERSYERMIMAKVVDSTS
jgi:GNAT superfamily N-acetyltransferase